MDHVRRRLRAARALELQRDAEDDPRTVAEQEEQCPTPSLVRTLCEAMHAHILRSYVALPRAEALRITQMFGLLRGTEDSINDAPQAERLYLWAKDQGQLTSLAVALAEAHARMTTDGE